MRLPGAKIHQLRALRAQLGSLGSHRHRCGNLNPANTVGQYLLSSRGSHCLSIFSDFRRNVLLKTATLDGGRIPPGT